MKNEENEGQMKNICKFCKGICKCSRCKYLLEFNKMMGLYHAFGGDF